jgi:hypothetical protein
MKSFSTWLKVLGTLVVIVVIGLAVGWFFSRGPALPSTQPTVADPAPSSPGTAPSVPPSTPRHPVPPPLSAGGTGEGNPTGGLPVNPANLSTNWEDRLDEILSSSSNDTNKLKELFEMFPQLPEEGQVEVAQHLSNLVEDSDYAALGKLLENGALPGTVQDVLMADLLNRPNGVKLPMFLEIARSPNHPKAEESRELLELYLDEDYGTDWPKWQEKLKDWMKENPD